jgi:hypothetical protein
MALLDSYFTSNSVRIQIRAVKSRLKEVEEYALQNSNLTFCTKKNVHKNASIVLKCDFSIDKK